VTPGDLWALRRKPRNQVVLYDDALLARPHQPFWFALRCFMEGSGRDLAMAVFQEKGIRSFVQARGRSGRPEQDIVYLSSHGDGVHGPSSDHDIWFRLLEQMCIHAGHNYIQRLYASIWSDQMELREIFRQLGFQAYIKRFVLQLSGPDWDQGTTLALMRAQSRRDAWAIHKLYGRVAPHLVQYAEVRTPRSWALALSSRWQRQRCRGWVLGPEDDLISYLHMLNGPTAHVFTMLLHPERRDSAADVLRFGLAQLQDNKPVYLLLAEYQSELLMPAQNLGFQPVGEQTLLMKSTVVPVRKSVLLSAFEPNLEPPRAAVPHISVPREDTDSYARTTRNYQ
jgi:hypothetical protein